MTFLHIFNSCCDIHALRGSSRGMIEKCQTSSSHVHPPSVHRSGLTQCVSVRRAWRAGDVDETGEV